MQNNMVCENRKARHDYFIEDTIEAGIRKAEQIIDEGLALKKLEQFREESQK